MVLNMPSNPNHSVSLTALGISRSKFHCKQLRLQSKYPQSLCTQRIDTLQAIGEPGQHECSIDENKREEGSSQPRIKAPVMHSTVGTLSDIKLLQANFLTYEIMQTKLWSKHITQATKSNAENAKMPQVRSSSHINTSYFKSTHNAFLTLVCRITHFSQDSNLIHKTLSILVK